MFSTKLTRTKLTKYPYIKKYSDRIEGSNYDLINSNVKYSPSEDKWSLGERLCVATLMSLAFTPIAGFIILIATSDICSHVYRNPNNEYVKFRSTTRE